MKTRELTIGALYSAMTLMIILLFSQFLKISLPPFFTATLMLHVPLFLSMMVSPTVSAMVGAVSAAGFAMTPLGPVVALRALTHSAVGYIGGKLIKRGVRYHNVLLITMPVHAILEGVVVLMVMGISSNAVKYALLTVSVGTAIHHIVDSAISLSFAAALGRITRHTSRISS